jgi:enolase
VSYGASAGSKEAFVLLDEDPSRYRGKGMLKAVSNVNEKIAPLLLGKESSDQRGLDKLMIEADGTENKQNFGANAILGVSMAIARASAASARMELFQFLQKSFNLPSEIVNLPKPMVVMIEGGAHADNSTDLQEYLVTGLRNDMSARENIRMQMEIYLAVKSLLKNQGHPEHRRRSGRHPGRHRAPARASGAGGHPVPPGPTPD